MTEHDPFQVGALWPDSIIHKEKTGNFYLYLEGNHLLVLCEPNLPSKRIKAVQENKIELALVVRENIFFLCHHFDGFASWGDIPYNWHIAVGDHAQLPPPPIVDGILLPLLVVLVEAETSRIVARRGLRLPQTFSRMLHESLRAQAAAPFTLEEFDQKIVRMHQEFPTPEHLAALAQATCIIEAKTDQRDRRN